MKLKFRENVKDSSLFLFCENDLNSYFKTRHIFCITEKNPKTFENSEKTSRIQQTDFKMKLLINSMMIVFAVMIFVGDADSNALDKENSRIISSILSKLVDISTKKPISTVAPDIISTRIYKNEENLKHPEEWKDRKSTQATGRI